MQQAPADDDLRAIARRMKSAQDEVRQIEPFTSAGRGGSFDMAAAYEVARLIRETRVAEGAVPVGRKIGFTNPGMWARYGVRQPIWGPMYDRTVVRLPAGQASTECSLAGLAEPKIEPEIVFGLRSAPAAGSGTAALLDCIEWVAHGFEMVQSHFPGWRFEAPDAIADGSLHGLLLLGEPQPVARLGAGLEEALASFSVALDRDSIEVETATGAAVLGSPLAALAHLVEVLAGQPQSPPLAAGEIVTTGTITAAYPVQPGETWRSRVQGIGLPGLEVRFTG